MLVVLLSVVLAMDSPVDASAAVEAKARELSVAAKSFFSERRYAEAIAKFRESSAVMANTANVYNIGKCHERLGETALALRSYRDYLRLEAKAREDAVLLADIARAEGNLRKQGVQQLVVYTEPPTARIVVDGVAALTASPAYVELAAGEHVLNVSADGYETARVPIVVSIDRISELTVSLRSAKTDAPRAQPMSFAPREATAGPISGLEQVSRPRRRIGTWVGAGVSVAAAGTAAGLGIACNGANRQLHTLEPNRTEAQATALASRTHHLATGTNVALGVAAAAAGAAVVLYFLEGP